MKIDESWIKRGDTLHVNPTIKTLSEQVAEIIDETMRQLEAQLRPENKSLVSFVMIESGLNRVQQTLSHEDDPELYQFLIEKKTDLLLRLRPIRNVWPYR